MRTDGTATLDHYLKPLLDHDKLIIAVTAVTTVLAVAAAFLLPARYESTASVLLTPISGNPLTALESDNEVDMATELVISTSKAVIGRVADDLAAESIELDAEELGDNVSSASPRNSKVLDLTYRAATPELAQTTADSFAANYLEYRAQIAAENRTEAVEVLNGRIAQLKEELSRIEAQLSRLEPGTEPHVALSVERDSVDGEIQAQQQALAALSTLSLNAGEVLSPARLPVTGTGPGLFTLVTGGLVGGLVIGAMLAMLVGAVKASQVPRNRRASDRIEHNRRQEDRLAVGGRRASDRPSESAVEKLARVTAGRNESPSDGDDDAEAAAADPEPGADDHNPEPSAIDYADPEADDHNPKPGEGIDETEPEATLTPDATDEPPADTSAVDPVAAHFGADVPPPPRNKAKLAAGPEPADVGGNSGPPSNGDGDGHRETAPSIPPASLEIEADFDRLAGEIQRRLTVQPLVCVAIGEDTRAQSVAAGFALVDGIKDLGVEVLVIDAMFDEPVLAPVLELPNLPGLGEILGGDVAMDSVTHPIDDFEQLHAITAGRRPDHNGADSGGRDLSDLLREARRRYSVTVVMAGRLDDAVALLGTSGEIDGLVVAASDPPRTVIASETADRLATLDAPVWIRVSISDRQATASTATPTTTNATTV